MKYNPILEQDWREAIDRVGIALLTRIDLVMFRNSEEDRAIWPYIAAVRVDGKVVKSNRVVHRDGALVLLADYITERITERII